MKTKSQVSLEFLFTVGIVLLIFIILVGFNIERKTDVNNLKNYVYLKSECFKLSNSITNAYISGDGFNLTAEIKYDASVFAENKALNINYDGVDVYCSFPVAGITNSTASQFDIRKGEVNIQNLNESIIIKNV